MPPASTARRADADLEPLQVPGRLVAGGARGGNTDADLRRGSREDEGLEALLPRLHVDRMLIGAGDHVRAAADDCLQRACATGKIADAHVEALVLEEAQALGESERQVIERGFAADGDVHVALLDLSMNQRGCSEQYPCE